MRITNRLLPRILLSACLTLIALLWSPAVRAQTTATWVGPSGDEWNTAVDWDTGAAPADLTTNAVIPTGITVNYNLPMAAGSIGTVTLNGILNVNAAGFVVGAGGAPAFSVSGSGARLLVNSGGAVAVTNGGLAFTSTGAGTLSAGGSLAVSGALNLGGSGSGNTGFMTNSGGSLSAASTSINPNNNSFSSLLVIDGGTNDLDDTFVLRSVAGSGGYSTLGTEGLIISNGSVTMSALNVGTPAANSFLTMLVAGGVVTNTGDFIIRQVTSGRGSRFLQTGGLVVSSGANGVQAGVTNAGQVVVFSVTGGTNVAQGFVLGTLTNLSGTVNFTNAASIYVGGGGLVSNAIQTLNVALNNGGRFGASADWTSSVPLILNSGTFTFDAEDLAGAPHNIALNHVVRGAGSLNKAGGGVLTLNATNAYTGNTLVSQGTLVLGAGGSVSNSSQISVAGGAVFDVSAQPGFTLLGNQKLAGSGSVAGAVTGLPGAAIQPGGNGAAGSLTFSNTLSETGGVLNNFDLSDDPTGTVKTNDFLYIAGDFTLSGANTLQVNALDGTLPPGSTYPLVRYAGNLNGSLANFSLAGATGSLSNNAVEKTISLVAGSGIPLPTSVVWVGSGPNNNWDTLATTNWSDGVNLLPFVTGDSVRFDATGAAHPVINVVGSVNPSNTVVDAATAYTFAGNGTLDGVGGLLKTNSGTLTVLLANNNYPGSTVLGGGTLEVTNLANGGAPSSLGAAASDPTNLVFFGAALRYLGSSTSTDRGATLNDAGGTIDVADAGATLTSSGVLAGPGALIKTGPGALALGGANIYAGGTVISNGVLQVNTVAAGGGAGLTNQGGALRFGASFTLANVVEFNGNCTIDLNNVAGDNALDGAWSGNGTVNIIRQQSASRTFTVGGNGSGIAHGSLLDFYGTLNMGTNSGSLRFNDGGANYNLGSTNVTIDLGSGSATFLVRNGGVTIDLGALAGGPNTRLFGRGSGSSGTVTYSIGGNNLSTAFDGSIVDGNNATAITKVGTGTWTLSGTNTYTGLTIVSNGVLALSGSGSLGNTPSIDLLSGAALDVSARTDGAVTLGSGQALTGEGAVRGSVIVASGATLSPGENAAGVPPGSAVLGQMTITNALVLQSGSSLVMDLDAFSGTNDTLTSLRSVTYGGTLNVGYMVNTFAATNTFKLFSAASYGGAFESITPDPGQDLAGRYLAWDTSTLAVDGTLRVALRRPAITNFSLAGTTLTLSGAGGVPGADFYLLTSTNVALPLSQWLSIATNQYGGDGGFTLTTFVDPNQRQQFYSVRTP